VTELQPRMSGNLVWDGRVLEVWEDGDTFTVDLRRDGAPDLLAEMSMAQTGVAVTEGDLLIVTPTSVTKRDLGVWTRAEIRRINRRARKQARWLRRYAD
jgi:hypothetical protein